MKDFINYLQQYLRQLSYKSLLLTILFVGTLVTINYTVGIEKRLLSIRPPALSLCAFFLFYGVVLIVCWSLQGQWQRRPRDSRWWGLLVLAALYFACKMVHWDFSPFFPATWSAPQKHYADIVLQLPAKLILLLALLFICLKAGWLISETKNQWRAVGLSHQGLKISPYFLLLLCLVPLVALAATQPDFLRVYPKVKNIAFLREENHPFWIWQVGYEISYALDFVSIELFFRGLLVIGLARYAGTRAILPMAAFYCTVHFGKPIAECISSFFGGLILGVLAARTRSILGGLVVHLGLAGLMEAGGWLGAG